MTLGERVRIATRTKLASLVRVAIFEWPVVILALVWLLWKLSIFRDQLFGEAWKYAIAMFAIGLAYFAYMLIADPAAQRAQPLAPFARIPAARKA